MTQIAESVWKSLQELSEQDRAEIAERIYESLGTAITPDADLAAWDDFLGERLAAADRGDFAPGSAFDVIEDVRREMHQMRESR